jgi:predicted short-subunit dehydrogenase-like oxidoreductase (DUF2520 family)
LALALAAAGWSAPELIGRETGRADGADGADRAERADRADWADRADRANLAGIAHGADFVVLATPDRAVAEVAGAIEPDPATVVVHLAGCHGLDVLRPHSRRAAVHPLVALPDPAVGAARLAGAWFAVSRDGDPAALAIPAALGGRIVTLDEDPLVRARYHAAACLASNHLVALLGQVERVGGLAGVPLEAYLDLVRATVDNVDALGPAAALTGPAARGDEATIARHLAALPGEERSAYNALLAEARKLRRVPACR